MQEPDARPVCVLQKVASKFRFKHKFRALILFALLLQKAGANVPPSLGAGRESGLGSLSKFQLENKPAQLPVRAHTLAFLTRLRRFRAWTVVNKDKFPVAYCVCISDTLCCGHCYPGHSPFLEGPA